MESIDLYNILELKSNANVCDIKKNFKRLALKYHPDKNKSPDSNEKFNQIRIAYEILSDPEKKDKYDKMLEPKKKHFTDTIFLFIKEITNSKTIQNIISRPDIIEDIKNGQIDQIAKKMIQKILDNIDVDIDMEQLAEIFIYTPTSDPKSNPTNIKSNPNPNPNPNPNFSVSNCSVSNNINTSDCNTLNIFGKIKTSLDDVYHNRVKEIIINRKIYNPNGTFLTETNKYYIPLYDYKVVISDAGDKIIDPTNPDNNHTGNVILRIKCLDDKELIRQDYDIIYNDVISLYELFYGFNKNIKYFGTDINICSENPFNEYSFDGKKITIFIENKGLPFDQEGSRGSLIINLYLNKSDDFEEKIKSI